MTHRKMHNRRNPRRGLILLIVLGMLAMFTLLAVTYVVTAGASRAGSVALTVKARNSNLTAVGTARVVLKEAIRGTNNQKSLFYGNSLLGDVFGANPIRTQFGPYSNNNSARLFTGTGVNLIKLSINPVAQLNGPLSPMENEYNSRIITIQEGPLAGQSFRILKYVGYVGAGDPNIDATPWSRQTYVDPLALDTQYSILIDLDEIMGSEFTGQYTDAGGSVKSVSLSLSKWVSTFGVSSLFYFKSTPPAVGPTTATMVGYKFLINDAPFNSPGIGVEDVAYNPATPVDLFNPPIVQGYGNIDGRRLLSTSVRVPPALLTHYDYLQDPNLMRRNVNGSFGVDGIGVTTRNWATGPAAYSDFSLNGSSNEGFDVADYRDSWLANQSFAGGRLTITPSYHRPEVINYISNLFRNPSSMSPMNVAELLRLIDASTARVLSYSFGTLVKNSGFRENDPRTVRLPSNFTWSSPPSAGEINALQLFVRNQIEGRIDIDTNGDGIPDSGSWDVDNNGDGFADSVWVDPGLPTVFAPDGRRLKPLASLLIEDLDGRINLNTSGDRVQGHFGYDATNFHGFDFPTNTYYKRASQLVPQSLGYGPADISLTALFKQNTNLLQSGFDFSSNPAVGNRFSLIDELTGGRRFAGSRIIFPNVNDRVSGIPRLAGLVDLSYVKERELHLSNQHNRLPAMPVAKRSSIGMTYDRLGNPAFVNPPTVDGDPYNPGVIAVADENRNDRYESAAMNNPVSDDPLGLGDLEAVLRRFDEDSASLPQRLRQKLNPIAIPLGLLDGVFSEITTRSGELRYPNLAAAMKRSAPGATTPLELTLEGQAPGTTVPSYLRYIQMMHAQRYRSKSFPPTAADDPLISYAALAELFPTDFAKGLRMDLNRPFGNGENSNAINGAGTTDTQVDEPFELNLPPPLVLTATSSSGSVGGETETFPIGTTSVGVFSREIKPTARKLMATVVDTNASANPFPSQTRSRLGSRQILARNLYCLAQLIIPRDYEFPGMNTVTAKLARARIRATAIAQWAVNVVDFRDADAAMTRFEFDILPFGSNTATASSFGNPTTATGALPSKLAYWAPDHIEHYSDWPLNMNPNKSYVGVVWGMEMPELLLTETLALHDTRLRNTDMDTTGKSTTDTMPDDDFDQLRFPQSSLMLEVYNPRTTSAGTQTLIPGVPSSLYNLGATPQLELDLDRMAPPNLVHPFTPTAAVTGTTPVWGAQPVWRIAISESYSAGNTDHPQAKLTAALTSTDKSIATVTHQWSTEQVSGGPVAEKVRTGATNFDHTNTDLQFVEQYLGTGLDYNLADPAALPPMGFDRFIWFTNTRPGQYQLIPDILPSIRTAGHERENVFTASAAGAALAGGSYMVIGPRTQTNIGSLTHNQFSSYAYPAVLSSTLMSTPGNRPIFSPAFQRIDLVTTGASTTLINNANANDPWMSRIKASRTLVCTTPAPTGAWTTAFPGGIGINISQPAPVNGMPVWDNPPTRQLNSTDAGASRLDGSAGFGSPTFAPDSWVDMSAVANTLPDTPIDYANPLLTGKLNTGTYENVRAAYLQRLADPDFAYDPVTNPYITVDWMSIDLTVFNGESPIGSDAQDTPTTIKFQSRYKNGALSPLANNDVETTKPLATPPSQQMNKGKSYYSPVTSNLRISLEQTGIPATISVPTIPTPVNPEPNFKYQLGYSQQSYTGFVGNSASTLGYCNVGYFDDVTMPPATPTLLPTLAQMNDTTNTSWYLYDGFGPPMYDPTSPIEYRGASSRIAGVTWFNRPFASPHELMMVPLTGPGAFGLHHSAFLTVQDRELNSFVPSYQTMNAWNVDLSTIPVPNPPNPPSPPSYNSYWAIPENLSGAARRLADWPLLLEFVETQAPFIDANRYYSPDVINSLATDNVARRFLNSFLPQGYTIADGMPTALAASDPATVRGPTLFAPFNMRPSYVAAGKINLNTISFDSTGLSRALKAIEHNYLAGERGAANSSLSGSFFNSRQGYIAPTPNAFFMAVVHPAMDANFPTRFVGAFRPAMSSNLAPALENPLANQKMRSRYGVETTLLRSLDPMANLLDVSARQSVLGDTPMLFDSQPPATTPPLATTVLNPAVADELKATQPFVRMQRAMRLPNLVTNQSNVFAVWVTVSLHEYDPIAGFGNEYVGETGLPERERQFFIVDRTIPVGFKPGEDLNTDRTILLQRKLP